MEDPGQSEVRVDAVVEEAGDRRDAGGYASAEEFNAGFVPATGAAAGFALAGAIAGALVPSRSTAPVSLPTLAVEGESAL